MTNRSEHKETLKRLDKDTRVCIKYLEGLIEEKFSMALKIKQPPTPKVDFSPLEARLDSLRKQIDGLRPKIEAGYKLSQEHDDQEKYLKTLTRRADEVLDGMKQHFEDLYDSGYYKEGTRRKIRDEKLISRRKNE